MPDPTLFMKTFENLILTAARRLLVIRALRAGMEFVLAQNFPVSYASCRATTRMESLPKLRGTRAWIVVPRLGWVLTEKLPLTSFSRSCM
jgi:hypothetical protein